MRNKPETIGGLIKKHNLLYAKLRRLFEPADIHRYPVPRSGNILHRSRSLIKDVKDVQQKLLEKLPESAGHTTRVITRCAMIGSLIQEASGKNTFSKKIARYTEHLKQDSYFQ